MNTSLRNHSMTVEREALALRPPVHRAERRRRPVGPSLRERIHDLLRGAGNRGPVAVAV